MLARVPQSFYLLGIHAGVIVHFLTLRQLLALMKAFNLRSIIVKRDCWRIMNILVGESVLIIAR